MSFTPQILQIFVALAITGFIPFIAVIATAFTKIAVTLLIVRNALGIQQTPPNAVVFGIALVLSLRIMTPVFADCLAIAQTKPFPETLAESVEFVEATTAPWRAYLLERTTERTRVIVENATNPPISADAGLRYVFAVAIPAFVADELTRAFQIGLLIYLPFVVVDLAVGALLVSMSMQSMSPSIISTPAKLLLFIAVEGWTKLLQNFLLSG